MTRLCNLLQDTSMRFTEKTYVGRPELFFTRFYNTDLNPARFELINADQETILKYSAYSLIYSYEEIL